MQLRKIFRFSPKPNISLKSNQSESAKYFHVESNQYLQHLSCSEQYPKSVSFSKSPSPPWETFEFIKKKFDFTICDKLSTPSQPRPCTFCQSLSIIFKSGSIVPFNRFIVFVFLFSIDVINRFYHGFTLNLRVGFHIICRF